MDHDVDLLWLLRELEWQLTPFIRYASDTVSHSAPPRRDDPDDPGSSGQGIVRFHAPVLKKRSHTSGGNADSGNNTRYDGAGGKSSRVSALGGFRDAIQNEELLGFFG